MIREDFFRMMREEFNCEPDYPFAGDFESAVFRHKDNLKWFAIVMTVDAKKLGIGAFGELDIVNLKCTNEDRERLTNNENVLPAYHMNKDSWITVALDGSVPDEKIKMLLSESYNATTSKTGRKRKQ